MYDALSLYTWSAYVFSASQFVFVVVIIVDETCGECCVVHTSLDGLLWFKSDERWCATTGHTFEVNAKIKLTVWWVSSTLPTILQYSFEVDFCRILFLFSFFFSLELTLRRWSNVSSHPVASWIRRYSKCLVRKGHLIKGVAAPLHFLHYYNKFETFCIDFYHASQYIHTNHSCRIFWSQLPGELKIDCRFGCLLFAAEIQHSHENRSMSISIFARVLHKDVATKWRTISRWLGKVENKWTQSFV